MKPIFNKKERLGFVILLLLSVLVYFSLRFLIKTTNRDKPLERDNIVKMVDSIKKRTPASWTNNHKKSTNRTPKVHRPLFYFDPNKASKDEWKKLGFSEKQSKVIMNYRNKGGRFYEKEDVKKLYVVSDSKYKELEPFILIGTPEKSEEKIEAVKTHKPKQRPLKIELNTADSTRLTYLKGIGPVFAARIIKYRNLLGGFVSKEQLNEVWGLKKETIEAITGQIDVYADAVKKININRMLLDSLPYHPYFKKHDWRAVVHYRKMHGAFQNCEDLRKVLNLDANKIEKICPYLDF